MEKIQTEAILPIQAGIKTRKYAAGETDSTFDRLLKDRNQAAEGKSGNGSVSDDDSKKTAINGRKEKPVATGKDKNPEPGAEDIGRIDEISGKEIVFSALFLPFAGSMNPISDETAGTEELLTAVPETVEEMTAGSEILQTAGEEAVVENTVEVQMPVSRELPQVPAEEMTVKAGEEIYSASQGLPQAGKAEKDGEAGRPEIVFEPKPEENPLKETQAKPVSLSEAGTAFERQAFQELPPETKEEFVAAKGPEARSSADGKPDVETQVLRTTDAQPREYLRNDTEMPVSVPVKTTPSSLVEDVGKTLAQKFPQNNGTLTIELEPASLGRLTIKVLYEDGKATVSILSTNPKTLELLSARATELASILEERTGQETIIYTQPSESEQPFDEKQGEERQKEQNPDGRERRERDGQDSFAQQLRLGLI